MSGRKRKAGPNVSFAFPSLIASAVTAGFAGLSRALTSGLRSRFSVTLRLGGLKLSVSQCLRGQALGTGGYGSAVPRPFCGAGSAFRGSFSSRIAAS